MRRNEARSNEGRQISYINGQLSAIHEAQVAFRVGQVSVVHMQTLKRYGGITNMQGDVEIEYIVHRLGISTQQVKDFFEQGITFAQADPTSRTDSAIVVRHNSENSHERDGDGVRGNKPHSAHAHGRGAGMQQRYNHRHSETND